MRYYPIFLDIQGRNCLVVGGGGVGTRKIENLLKSGALVTVVSIHATDKILEMAHRKRIILKQRAYRSSDLDDMFLVIGATNNEKLNQQVHLDAEARNLLCNIADRPAACNFILPSIITQGDLVLAISTSGKSPAYAKRLRQKLQDQFDEAHGVFLNLMGAIRDRLLKDAHAPEQHKPLFNQLIDNDIVMLIREGQFEKIDELFLEILGPGYTVDELLNPEHHP